MSAGKTDPISALLAASEALRMTARSVESLELGDLHNRDELRGLLADIRRSAFQATSLAAVELRASIAARQLTAIKRPA